MNGMMHKVANGVKIGNSGFTSTALMSRFFIALNILIFINFVLTILSFVEKTSKIKISKSCEVNIDGTDG